jgi:hypothetical protein
VAVVIGKVIEYYNAATRTPQDQIFVIILRTGQILAYKTIPAFIQALNVAYSPWCPQIFAFQPALTSVIFLRLAQDLSVLNVSREAALSISGR